MAKPAPNTVFRTYIPKNLTLDPATLQQRMHSALQFQAPDEDFHQSPAKPPPEATIRLSSLQPSAAKPSISLLKDSVLSEKSRFLAAKAEQRFFAQHKVPQLQEAAGSGGGIDVQSRNLWEMGNAQGAEGGKVELSPTFSNAQFSPASKTPSKGELRAKIRDYLKDPSEADRSTASRGRNRAISADMQYFLQRNQPLAGPLQVAQRGNSWNDQRKLRSTVRKTSQEREKLTECTFTPVIYTKIPHHLHKMPAPALLNFKETAIRLANSSQFELTEGSKAVSTPKSQQSTAVHTRVHSGSQVGSQLGARLLSPVAYRFGMDWERLESGGN